MPGPTPNPSHNPSPNRTPDPSGRSPRPTAAHRTMPGLPLDGRPPLRPLPARSCINAPAELCFRGRIVDGQHLSVEHGGARRVISAPRLADLPIPMVARLTLDPSSLSCVFAFAGSGLTKGERFGFEYEVSDLWPSFRAAHQVNGPRGGWAGTGPLPSRLEIRHRSENESLRLFLDLSAGWAHATGSFAWRRIEQAPDAPAWLDRHASGVIEQAWSPTGHAVNTTRSRAGALTDAPHPFQDQRAGGRWDQARVNRVV